MSRPEQRIRQQFSVVVGWLGVAVGAALVVSGLLAREAHTCLAGVALAAAAYCVMCHPSLLLTHDAVVARNVIREVTMPWEGISHATSRGSLVIHDNDGARTTVWAISSQKAHRSAGDEAPLRAGWRPQPGELAELPTSSRAVAEGINAETVDNPADVPSGRRVRWLPLPCLLMTVAAACTVAAVVI